jgi:hypothetical protein
LTAVKHVFEEYFCMYSLSSAQDFRSRPKLRLLKRPLCLEALEDRTLLSVDVINTYTGLTDTNWTPPDTNGAAGQNYYLETVNSMVAFFNPSTGSRVFSRSLQSFFAPDGATQPPFDPVVTYQEQYHRWVVAALEGLPGRVVGAWMNIAVSEDDTSDNFDPSTAFRPERMYRIDAQDNGTFADYPKIGWNADALVISTNQLGSNPHAELYTFTGLFGDPSDFAVSKVRPPQSNHTLAPATMHDAKPGDPMWLVERGTATNTIRVVRMDDVTSATPTFTFTSVGVATYGNPPRASQPGGLNTIDTLLDARIMNAAYRGGRLVAAHTVNGGGAPRVRWYEFDVSSGTPAPFPTQAGEIDQGPGVGTYYPSIDINAEGDLGMTFMESSADEYISMYVTGQSVFDAGGTMQDAVVTHPGINFYRGNGQLPYRAGDYSTVSVAPDGISFSAGNMYKGTSLYNTGIANFLVSPNGLAPRRRALFLTTISGVATPINAVVERTSPKLSAAADALLGSQDATLDVSSVNRLFALAAAESPAKVLGSKGAADVDWDGDNAL